MNSLNDREGCASIALYRATAVCRINPLLPIIITAEINHSLQI